MSTEKTKHTLVEIAKMTAIELAKHNLHGSEFMNATPELEEQAIESVNMVVKQTIELVKDVAEKQTPDIEDALNAKLLEIEQTPEERAEKEVHDRVDQEKRTALDNQLEKLQLEFNARHPDVNSDRTKELQAQLDERLKELQHRLEEKLQAERIRQSQERER